MQKFSSFQFNKANFPMMKDNFKNCLLIELQLFKDFNVQKNGVENPQQANIIKTGNDLQCIQLKILLA